MHQNYTFLFKTLKNGKNDKYDYEYEETQLESKGH